MSRIRWIASFGAATLGVAAIATGVHLSRADQPAVALKAAGSATDTEVTELPQLDLPVDATTTSTTPATTVVAPTPTTAAPRVTTTTAAPPTTVALVTPTTAVAPPTTVPPPAQVKATNETAAAVKVYVGDDSEHAKVLAPGESVTWVVTAGTGHPDSGGAVEPDTHCGTKWNDEDMVVAGHSYLMTIRSSTTSKCPSGKAWPTINYYDATEGYGWFRGGPGDLPRTG